MAYQNTKLMSYTPIIGLEVHVELKTKSKMFCRCAADYFGQKPNTHTCPVCLGLPGAQPVANKKAIEWCIMVALSLNCEINLTSKFDRKNYFYPDLPKGYQISQYDLPFGKNGSITLSSGTRIGITRVHMEEDTGKLSHQVLNGEKASLIDFNRSGVPLVEIVTEPDFRSASDVKEYLQKLQRIVRALDVSNADMEKGDMRLEPNISLTTLPLDLKIDKEDLPKYKVEVKNINSFRFVEKAIEFETKRQREILEQGKLPVQETRGFVEASQSTISQRIKEEANDYRYFPEPDLPPLVFAKDEIERIKGQMPELPDVIMARFINEFGLSQYDAEIITRDIALTAKFQNAVINGIDANKLAKAIINKKIDQNLEISEWKKAIDNLSKTATVENSELQNTITKILKENEKAVNDYKAGKETVLMFLLGQVMRSFPEKIDANLAKEQLITALKS